MATAYVLTSAKQPALNPQGTPDLIVRSFTINWATELGDASYATVINDTFDIFKIPAFVKLLGASIDNSGDVDDGANTMEIDLIATDGTTPYLLLDGGVASAQAGITSSFNGTRNTHTGLHSVTLNGDYVLQAKVIVAGTNDLTDNLTSVVTLYYTGALDGAEGIRDMPAGIPT